MPNHLFVCTLFLAVTIVLAPACASDEEQARSRAIASVRASHQSHLDFAADILETVSSPEEAGKALTYRQPVVASYRLEGDELTWISVFIARGEAGGGLTYEGWSVRACISYSGVPGRASEITWANAECPSPKRSDPTFDETVRIEP